MESNIEALFKLAGNKGRYQILLIVTGFLFWLSAEFLVVSFPFLEKSLTVEFEGKLQPFRYEMCGKHYNVVDSPGYSWVVYFKMFCDPDKTALIASSSFIGNLVGSLTLNYLTDSIGRRTTLILAGLGTVLSELSTLFIEDTTYLFIACAVLNYFAVTITMVTGIIIMENSHTDIRSIAGSILFTGTSVSALMNIYAFNYFQDWKANVLLAAGIGLVCCITVFAFTTESPRFYLINGNVDGFLSKLEFTAKFNGRPFKEKLNEVVPSDEALLEKRYSEIVDELKTAQSKRVEETQQSLFKHSSQLRLFLVMSYFWSVVAGTYYGLNIFIKNLEGDIMVNGMFVYCFELIILFLTGYLSSLPILGRKGGIILFEGLTVALLLGREYLPLNEQIKTAIGLLAMNTISCVYSIIYTYTSEVYVSSVRVQGYALNSVIARVSCIIFPFLIEYFQEYITIFLAGINIVALCMAFSLEETLGKSMKETIPEVEEDCALKSIN